MEDYRDGVDSGLVNLLTTTQQDILKSTGDERAKKVKEYLMLYDRYLKAVSLDHAKDENVNKYLLDYNKLEFEKSKLEEELKRRDSENSEKNTLEHQKLTFDEYKFEFEKQKYSEEMKYKKSEDREAKRDGWIKLGITTGVPIIAQSIWMALMWKFEEEGSITAETSKGVFRNIFSFWKK